MAQCISFPKLDDSQVDKVRNLEGQLGKTVLAVRQECHWADLDQDQLQKLQETEQDLGVILLAYEQE